MRIASNELRIVEQRRGIDQCVKRRQFVAGRKVCRQQCNTFVHRHHPAFARCQHDVVGEWCDGSCRKALRYASMASHKLAYCGGLI